MKSLLLVLLVLQGTCSLLGFTHSRYILSRFSINSSSNPKTTSSYDSGTGSNSRIIQSYPAFNNRAGRRQMSKAFDEFRRKAEDILPKEHADNETISRIAFHLLEKDNELELQKVEMQCEKKLEKVQMESDAKLRHSTAFHSKQLSAVVQRLVVCL